MPIGRLQTLGKLEKNNIHHYSMIVMPTFLVTVLCPSLPFTIVQQLLPRSRLFFISLAYQYNQRFYTRNHPQEREGTASNKSALRCWINTFHLLESAGKWSRCTIRAARFDAIVSIWEMDESVTCNCSKGGRKNSRFLETGLTNRERTLRIATLFIALISHLTMARLHLEFVLLLIIEVVKS